MIFNKLIIKNFKQFRYLELELNADLNILVGDNESGKSTILEAITLVTTGRFGGRKFEGFLSNDIFNCEVVAEYLASLATTKKLPPPAILIELYAENSQEPAHSKYKGQNNSMKVDVPGMRFEIIFNEKNSGDVYVELLKRDEVKNLPLEFYFFEWQFFSGGVINSYNNPISASIIDTAQVNNNIIGSYIGFEIKDNLSDDEIRDLGMAYRNSRDGFAGDKVLKRLNAEIATKAKFNDHAVGITLTSVTVAEWQRELSLSVDNVPFPFSGRGTQNTIKANLALGKSVDPKTKLLLIEEPENNLSYTNMSRLIAEIIANNAGKQVFIATHSSFVANKLGLDKITLFSRVAKPAPLVKLPKDTIDYFKKLPGYETLRLAIASKVILVEGPTDELIIQAAYYKKHKRLPINDGIDIISVRSLAFKRFCDIAVLLNKPIAIVTDNDGSIDNNITKKYANYDAAISAGIISIFYEKNNDLHTIEPSFVAANSENLAELRTLFGRGATATVDEIVAYMVKNKTEWALRIFDNSDKFDYPENVYECITHIER